MPNTSHIIDWHHAPIHKLCESGTYMVTAGTHNKEDLFNTPEKRDILMAEFFRLASEFQWEPQAWAFMINHYHVVLMSPQQADSLSAFIQELHRVTAKQVNEIDETLGRRVWFQYWDKRLTFHESYCARLKYVHENPVHHGVVREAEEYRWGSACWFKQHADSAFQKMIGKFKTDRLNVYDSF
ncbi:MAG: transposase [Lentisphaeria bacterium]